MPGMIAVEVGMSLRCEQMERCQLQIVDRVYSPAVATISLNVTLRKSLTALRGTKESASIQATLASLLQQGNRFRQGTTRSSTHCSILAQQQRLSLDRPGHQFAVQAYPLALKALPEGAGIQGSMHTSQELSFELAII